MQFIVIYGIRFIYGGQSGLPGDWEGAGLGCPASGREGHTWEQGLCPAWALLPLPGALALWLLASAFTKPMPPADAHLPPDPNPHIKRPELRPSRPPPKDSLVRKWQQVEVKSLFPAVIVRPLGGFHLQPHWYAGPWQA